MNKMKLLLVSVMACLTISGMAQVNNLPNTQQDYYLYSYIEVRWANKANGDQCFVILKSPGDNGQQRPSIMKNSEGKTIVVRNIMEGLAYLEVNGWEILAPRTEGGTGKWIVRKKISFSDLNKIVQSNTTYETITPKVQLTLSEKTLKVDYE